MRNGGRILVTSKGGVLIDGACLVANDPACGTTGPLVRLPGATKFVKVGGVPAARPL